MAGTFNQSLQCTQDVFVSFQAPSPPVLAGKWWVPSTRAYNVLKMFSLVSRPLCPQCEPLEALRPSIVDILGIGDELRRRRSVGSRHFDVEDGFMVQGATANTVVVSS